MLHFKHLVAQITEHTILFYFLPSFSPSLSPLFLSFLFCAFMPQEENNEKQLVFLFKNHSSYLYFEFRHCPSHSKSDSGQLFQTSTKKKTEISSFCECYCKFLLLQTCSINSNILRTLCGIRRYQASFGW